MSKTVPEYLREVDYSNIEDYKPSAFAVALVDFIKLVEGGNPENKSPVFHYKFIDTMVKRGNTINLCFRGAAKSSLFKYLIFYLAIFRELPDFGEVTYVLYISDTADNGIKTMRKALETTYEKSAFLKQCISRAKFVENEWQFTNTNGDTFYVMGYGANQGVRGTQRDGYRPQLALFDDLLSDKNAESPTVIADIKNIVYKAVYMALHPQRKKVIWAGTPFHQGDPLYSATESGAWNVNVFPVCNQFPCAEKDFVGAWEDRFNYQSVQESYNMMVGSGESAAFYQELMLRITSEEDRLIKPHEIQWYYRKTLLTKKHNFNFYITTDFTASEKKSGDYAVISVWAYSSGGELFWVDGICAKQDMNQSLEDLFSLVQKYSFFGKILPVGIEVSGQQQGFIGWIKNEMINRNIFFVLASSNNSGLGGIRPLTSKISRFNVVLPWFRQMKVHFPNELKEHPAMKEMQDELGLVTAQGFRSKHDDFVDTISMLGVMSLIKPSQYDLNMVKNRAGVWDYSDFDEDPSHACDSYIV